MHVPPRRSNVRARRRPPRARHPEETPSPCPKRGRERVHFCASPQLTSPTKSPTHSCTTAAIDTRTPNNGHNTTATLPLRRLLVCCGRRGLLPQPGMLSGLRSGQTDLLTCSQRVARSTSSASPVARGASSSSAAATAAAAAAGSSRRAAVVAGAAARTSSRRSLSSSSSSSCCSSSCYTSSSTRLAAARAAAPLPSPAINMADDASGVAAVSVRGELLGLFKRAIAAAFPQLPDEAPAVAQCANAQFGDYQCNNAMGLFGKLKGKEGAPKSPRDAATAMVAALPPNDVLDSTSLAGPGFVNCKVSTAYLARRVDGLLKDGVKSLAPALRYKRVVVDFSSPNVAKEMHVGHLRSTIIGDTICRTLELCGADVVRLNHIGDWGTQFGMLIQHMAELRPDDGGLAAAKDEDVADLQQLYRAAKQRFDEDDGFKARAREAVTRLQGGDDECMAAWRRICAASRREFEAIYSRLGVTLSERGESFYNAMLKGVVEELRERGVATVSEGATCVFVEGSEVPLIVQKSDGGFGYASTDMAAIKQRVQEEKADWIIYVTDVGQAGHFDLVFAAARKVGWLPPKGSNETPRVSHVGFGLVLGEDGKKFKTRSGDVVRLVELLDEAKARCRDQIAARRAEAGEDVSDEELDAAAGAMGYGAVKYADLKNSRLTNYKFSFDGMLELKGNTAVYLLYAHARIASIARKAAAGAGADADALVAAGTSVGALEHPKERELALAIARLPEAIEDMLEELMPNRLTDYLYALSEAFTGFYTECKVVGHEHEAQRLLLVEATARVMRACFGLLGITPLYRL